MCAFFDIYTNLKKMKKKLEELGINLSYDDISLKFEVKNNVRLTENALVLIKKNVNANFTVMNWGIRFGEDSPLIFNSRIETIKSEDNWRDIFSRGRCLIPMTAFIEYRKREDDPPEIAEWKRRNKVKKNTPFSIKIKDEPFFFAPGIFTNINRINYFSIITTPPPPAVGAIPYKRSLAVFQPADSVDYLFSDTDYCLEKIVPFSGMLEVEEVKNIPTAEDAGTPDLFGPAET
jgi:putative SOS response-associated peptidase YedK